MKTSSGGSLNGVFALANMTVVACRHSGSEWRIWGGGWYGGRGEIAAMHGGAGWREGVFAVNCFDCALEATEEGFGFEEGGVEVNGGGEFVDCKSLR